MLGPAIFIGCGGSGVMAVRYIKAAVERSLRRVEWTEGVPAAWQFLGIDTPTDQEHGDQVALLRNEDYLVASHNTYQSYHGLHRAVINERSPGTAAYRELIGWRPDPNAVDIPLLQGAGQARAVGRMVGIYGLEALLRERLRKAFAAAETQQDVLRRVSTALSNMDQQLGGEIGAPLVVILSSVAGGTGAGISLDVVDLVRAAHELGENPILVLFTPDIFGNLPDSAAEALGGNSLAYMSELLNAYWSQESAASPVWGAFDGTRAPGRGPYATFLVGRHSTRGTTLPDASSVYAVTGEALSNWIVNDQVRTEISSYVTGNWEQSASGSGSAGGYRFASQQQTGAVTSFGAATISLGRDRFERWAVDGIAHGILKLLLEGHTRSVFDLPNNAEEPLSDRIERIGKDIAGAIAWGTSSVRYTGLQEFAARSGYEMWSELWNKRGILARGALTARATYAGEELAKTEFREVLKHLEQELGEQERSGDGHVVHLRGHRGNAIAQDSRNRADDVRSIDESWGSTVLQTTLQTLSTYTAETSLRVILEALKAARRMLENEAAALRSDAAAKKASADEMMASSLQQLGKERRSRTAQHAKIAPHVRSFAQGIAHVWWSERLVTAADRLMKVHDLLFGEADDALSAALKEAQTSRDDPSASRWPDGFPRTPDAVASAYRPTEAELVLESHEIWPVQLDQLCKDAQVGHAGELRLMPFEALVYGIVEGSQLELVPLVTSSGGGAAAWSPSQAGRADIRCKADLSTILDMARACFEKGNHLSFKEHVDTGLRSYLAQVGDDGKALASHQEGMERFKKALEDARNISVPLVELNQQLYGEVFGEGRVDEAHYITSAFPFDESTPPAVAAREVFGDDVALATGAEATSVLISSRLSRPIHPMFVRSFTEPVRKAINAAGDDLPSSVWQYRRSRRLNQFVPVPPGVLSCMIRGFVTARLCGYITADPYEPIRISSVRIDGYDSLSSTPLSFPGSLTSINDGLQVLPALLENFALAVGRVEIDGLGVMEPYNRLFSLGNEGSLDIRIDRTDTDDSAVPLHPDLEIWLKKGESSVEFVDDPKAAGGSEVERRENAVTYLNANIQAVKDAVAKGMHGASLDTREKTGIARGNTMMIEIADEVVAGYASVLKAIEAAPDAAGSVV